MKVTVSGERPQHPKERACFLSKVTFFYNLGLIWKTFKTGNFKEGDLYKVLKKCKADEAGNELEKILRTHIEKNKKVSVNKILLQCYGVKYLILGIIQLLVRSIVIITIPMMLSKVVLYFQPSQSQLSKSDAIFFASLLILLNFSSITYLHNYLLTLSELGIKMRTAFCSVIFRKCLKMSSTALSDFNTGKIVTLITKDVAAIETFIFYCNDTWIGILQVVIVLYLIYERMGVSTFIGMGFFVAVVPLQILIGKITSKLRLKSSKKTDERLQTTKETLSGITTIKMNNWEGIFEDRINKSRTTEMSAILKIFLTKTSILLIGSLTSRIALYLLLTSYVLLDNTISAELIYYITTLFLRIRHALNVAIPVGVTVIADMAASVQRIEKFLGSEEIPAIKNDVEYQKKSQINLENVSVDINNKRILENVNLKIDSGLLLISGPVGSGKTTVLKTILGEYELQNGTIIKQGKISYAGQQQWIFPATFKQNIIFDQEFDEQRYQRVLEVCALNFDLQYIPAGDTIPLGDKGMNLSKGQKARINLARAVYKKADLYILDDCLTCLDTHVQQHVFQKCIKEFLADKICVYVTQNLQLAEEKDKIAIMDKGNMIFIETLKDVKTEYLKNEEPLQELKKSSVNEEVVESQSENSKLLTKNNDRSMYTETNSTGKVPFKMYKKYCDYGGGLTILTLIIFLFLGAQFSKRFTEKILSNWVNSVHQNLTRNTVTTVEEHLTDMSLILYTIFTLSTTLLSIISAVGLFNFTRKASLKLHKTMLKSVLQASMEFFDKHLFGNILNRFSKDLNIVDELIPFAIYEFLELVFDLCGIVILLASVNLIFLVPTSIIFVTFYFLRKLYMPIGRNLQRLDTATRSPIIGHLNSSLEGLVTIRAFQAEKSLRNEFDKHQDLFTSANFTSKCCERAFGYYLDICCTLFIAVIIGTFIIFDTGNSVGDVGLAITTAFTLTGVFQYGIRKWAEIENKMTSVERIVDYTNVEKEISLPTGGYKGWPKENSIEFKNVSFAYGNIGNYILKNINLIISPSEKIGIVGRTGSGKSTLVSLLFRLYPYEGNIMIGSTDVKSIPLKSLRSNISIITQDPILFTDTMRKNLDPTNERTDEEIWNIVNKLRLTNLIQSLDEVVSESGLNFSSGQRQLICLARCLLTKNKILILDEATSDMDQDSENLISIILEEHFKDCIVLVIAHRLKNVLNCNKVVVISKGEIVENGEVKTLKNEVNSIFYNMLATSGLL